MDYKVKLLILFVVGVVLLFKGALTDYTPLYKQPSEPFLLPNCSVGVSPVSLQTAYNAPYVYIKHATTGMYLTTLCDASNNLPLTITDYKNAPKFKLTYNYNNGFPNYTILNLQTNKYLSIDNTKQSPLCEGTSGVVKIDKTSTSNVYSIYNDTIINGQLGAAKINNDVFLFPMKNLLKLPLTNIKQLIFAYGCGFAVTGDGLLYSWGSNISLLGNPAIINTTQSINPRVVPGITNVKKVMYSSSFMMALTNTNDLYVWNKYGAKTYTSPTKIASNVQNIYGSTNITQGNINNAFYIDTNGLLYECNSSTFILSNLSSTIKVTDVYAYQSFPTVSYNVRQTTGNFTKTLCTLSTAPSVTPETIFIKTSTGDIYCKGYNVEGNLGMGTSGYSNNRFTPVTVQTTTVMVGGVISTKDTCVGGPDNPNFYYYVNFVKNTNLKNVKEIVNGFVLLNDGTMQRLGLIDQAARTVYATPRAMNVDDANPSARGSRLFYTGSSITTLTTTNKLVSYLGVQFVMAKQASQLDRETIIEMGPSQDIASAITSENNGYAWGSGVLGRNTLTESSSVPAPPTIVFNYDTSFSQWVFEAPDPPDKCCSGADCKAKQSSLTASFQPWNSKDLSECDTCSASFSGSYDPCTTPKGDCINTQTSLTASNIKWSGSDLQQCQACGSLKQNSFDPCKSASCKAKQDSLTASYIPWNSKDLAECNYCPDQTGSYNPCSASGECATQQANLTASNIKWSGSDIPQCQACGSLKQNSFDPCKSDACKAKQASLTASFQPWNSADLSECNYCDSLTGSYQPCAPGADCEKTQQSLTASNIKWSGSSIPQCQACGSLKQNSFDPCKSDQCKAKQASLTASFQPWNSADLSECNYCDSLSGSYQPCAPGADCEKTQQSLTASNIKWTGSDIPQCQACGSLKNNSFDPCKSDQCKAKQASLTASYIPWNSKDIPECDKCDSLAGSYEPCSASGDCQNTQASLTASRVKWAGSDLPQCQACGTLKQNSYDPCKSEACKAKQSSLTASFLPWNSKDLPECDSCDTLSASYTPCSASGECDAKQQSLTASGIPWSGSSLAECQACDSDLKGKSWAPPVASSSSSAAPVASSSSSAAVASSSSFAAIASSSSSAAPIASSSSSWMPFASSSSSAPPPYMGSSSSWLPFAPPPLTAAPQPQQQQQIIRVKQQPTQEPKRTPLQRVDQLPTLPKPPIVIQLNNVNQQQPKKPDVEYPRLLDNCNRIFKQKMADGSTISRTKC